MKLTTVIASILIACTPVAAQQHLSIDRLAPKDAILVVGVDNFTSAYQHFNATSLPQIFELEPLKKIEEERMEDAQELSEYEELMNQIFEELGIEEDPTKIMPTGAAGLAVYLHTMEDSSRRPGVFAFADYGENAQHVQTVIDRLLERADEDDAVEYEVEEVLGRKVYSFTQPEGSKAMDEALGELDPGMGMPTPGLEEMFSGMKTVSFARDGSVYYIGTEMTQLVEAFELVDEDASSGLADSDDFLGARSQIGDSDVYGMAFIRPIFKLMAEADPGAAFYQGLVVSLIGDIKAISVGVNLDGRSAMVEGTMGVYMPGGKSGITMLLDRPAPRGDLPVFVGPNAVSYSAINFDMSGLGDFVMGFIRGNPMLAAQFGEEMMPVFEQTLETLSTALGNQVYTVATMERPIKLENMGTLVAIRCTDPQAVENTIAEFAPQMGLQPRDFLGNRIYAMDPQMAAMMGAPGTGPAVGLGGGYVFMGTEAPVQQALRAGGHDNLPTLAGESSYNRAVAALSTDNVIAWGFNDFVTSLEMQLESVKLQQQQQIEMMREWDPEFAAEMEKDMTDPTRYWTEEDWARLRELLGPQAWEMTSTDNGFVSRFYQFRGRTAE